METKVTRVDLDDPDGGVEVTAMKASGATVKYHGRFLLDASGRDTFMANRNGWKKPHPQLDRTALSTHWMGGNQLGGIAEGLLQILYLGGDKQGWIWVIPILEGRLSVGVVLNDSYIHEQKVAAHAWEGMASGALQAGADGVAISEKRARWRADRPTVNGQW